MWGPPSTSRSWLAMATLVLTLGVAAATQPGFAQPAEQGERQVESRIANVNGELIQLDDGTRSPRLGAPNRSPRKP